MITAPLPDKRPPASNVSLSQKSHRLQRLASQTLLFQSAAASFLPSKTFAESQHWQVFVMLKQFRRGLSDCLLLLYFYVFVACECNTTEGRARARLRWEHFLICGF